MALTKSSGLVSIDGWLFAFFYFHLLTTKSLLLAVARCYNLPQPSSPLQDNSQYKVVSEVRGQLKVLESIDRLNHKRKQEREKEKILRAAKSRSKAEDPEAAAKIKEQAKQVREVVC